LSLDSPNIVILDNELLARLAYDKAPGSLLSMEYIVGIRKYFTNLNSVTASIIEFDRSKTFD
jgi:hypothetical protein